MLQPLLSLALAFAAGQSTRPGQMAPVLCAGDAPVAGFALRTLVTERDSTMRVTVCLAAPAARRIGSYHGEIAFNAASARVLGVEKQGAGMRIENTLAPGKVSFAGAVPAGLGSGALLTVVLVRARPELPIVPALRLLELNDIAGISVLAAARVTNGTLPASAAVPVVTATPAVANAAPGCARRGRNAPPVLLQLAPGTVHLSSGDQTPVVVRGCGFMAKNVVEIGGTRLVDIRATDGGRRLRFTVPATAPATGEVAPMVLPTGVVQVVVTNSRGRSNALPLTLQ